MKFLFIVNKQVSLEVADSGENATKVTFSHIKELCRFIRFNFLKLILF